VVVATDLTDDAIAPLVRGFGHAAAVGAPVIVCHVVPDVMRHHPLFPQRSENDLVLETDLTKRAADLVTEQVGRLLKIGVDAYRVVVETGRPDEEIVRVAEREGASMVALGAKPRRGVERVLGRTAERVVRYAHTSVLVARSGHETGKVIVPTDFGEGSIPALRLARQLQGAVSIDPVLLHVLELPSAALTSALAPIGVWVPVSHATVNELEKLGQATLANLAAEYGFARFEQVIGEPADVIVERATALDAEMIVMGSRGRTGFARLVLGSVAEKVIRTSHCSVLVVREA
jgi:nucleotide-binding universal stress UspA family protein